MKPSQHLPTNRTQWPVILVIVLAWGPLLLGEIAIGETALGDSTIGDAVVGPTYETSAPTLLWGIELRAILSLTILTASAFIQATVGFAAALFGLPLMLWAGNDLMESQVMIITAMLPQNILSVWKLRKSIDLREVIVPAVIRISALPIGIAGLSVVLQWSSTAVNQLVGIIILGAVGMQALVGIEWKTAKRPHWIIATFGGSGVLQGLSGMSAPPMVLWVHGQRYSADHARAFLFAMYISNFAPQVLLLYLRFGDRVLKVASLACLSIPLILLAATVGLRLGSWLGDRWLRPITYACLIWLALSSVLEPWLTKYVYVWISNWFSVSS